VSAHEFPWLAPARRSRALAAAQSERRAAMYRAELIERAALLCRLGYSSRRTVARLKANVAWDSEQSAAAGSPAITDREIGELVKAAYLRRANR
jgi:hypothetical protein